MILAKLLVKILVSVVEGLVVEAQICAFMERAIHDNLQFIRYSLEQVGKNSGKKVALANLDQSNDFGRVDHKYLAAAL